MKWLPSTRTRYLLLGVSFLAVLALLDGVAKAVVNFGGFGFAVTVWVCFGAAYAWLLVEPIVDAALVLRKGQDKAILERVDRIGRSVALECKVATQRFVVYQHDKFDVMVVGIGRTTTIFVSEAAATLAEPELRAVLAHEYSHIRLGHSVTRLLLYGSLLALAMIGNNTPLVALLANIFVLWTMRQMEYAADNAAAKIVGEESVSAALELVCSMLGDIPKWQSFFSTHPTFKERIERLT
jgi:Zn-dependent protease with chaperone function